LSAGIATFNPFYEGSLRVVKEIVNVDDLSRIKNEAEKAR